MSDHTPNQSDPFILPTPSSPFQTEGLKHVGTLLGMDVLIDPSLEPDSVKIVSGNHIYVFKIPS